ncbi:MAG: trypsin-like serine protease [Gluconobacter potus]|uniref:Serine protease n=1 Tax=Gluconobacter potus TaxID=2724927 RepID=A0ABR9YL89_9PROT|nr:MULTISPECIES: trypsin-like serine protease [Gluconobacter]MBF0864730.1 trypsin-like serine protease [Gluconobacter sp. R71656]MBF0866876.1 trypsin-like serine protease [Gluconobacter sp. R75628]MBF0873247.1 trypsin-like serine protease [Gluconobacter sp. R75629]MBF0882552.1 trypsin-like serine protease [Gluconobacter potus]
MKRAAALLIVCLSGGGAIAAPALALPGLGADSHRSVVDVNTAPWRILGRVQTSLGGRCTGFAVAPTVMLTAAHCLWLPATRHYIQPEDVYVLMGYAMGQYRLHAQVTRFVIAPGYDPTNEGGTASEDRATLVLDRPVVLSGDLVPYGSAPMGAAAMLVGYPQDRPEVPYGDISCQINGLALNGLIHHDCSATRGDSGGPLFVRQPDGQWGIVGIDVLATEGRGGFAAPLPH